MRPATWGRRPPLPGERRAAAVTSGGLSHFVVDRELDEQLLDGMRTGDLDALRALPACRSPAGTGVGLAFGPWTLG